MISNTAISIILWLRGVNPVISQSIHTMGPAGKLKGVFLADIARLRDIPEFDVRKEVCRVEDGENLRDRGTLKTLSIDFDTINIMPILFFCDTLERLCFKVL